MRLAHFAFVGLLATILMGCGGEPAKPEAAPAAPAPAPPAVTGEPPPPPAAPVAAVEPPPVIEPSPAPEPPPIPVDPLVPNPPAVAPPVVAERPDELVKQIATELSENRPQILWYALPESYQNEIFQMLAGRASDADPELWNAVFKVLGDLSTALKTKKDAIFNYPNLHVLNIELEVLDQYYDPTVEFLSVIYESKLREPNDAKKINIGDLLAESGSRLMEQSTVLAEALLGIDVKEQLKSVTATIVKEEGGNALLKIEGPDQFSEEVEFVRVEGKWLPKQLVDSWPKFLDSAREMVKRLPVTAGDKKKRDQQLLIVGVVQGFIANVNKAESDEKLYDQLDMIFRLAGYKIPNRKKGVEAGETPAEPAP